MKRSTDNRSTQGVEIDEHLCLFVETVAEGLSSTGAQMLRSIVPQHLRMTPSWIESLRNLSDKGYASIQKTAKRNEGSAAILAEAYSLHGAPSAANPREVVLLTAKMMLLWKQSALSDKMSLFRRIAENAWEAEFVQLCREGFRHGF